MHYAGWHHDGYIRKFDVKVLYRFPGDGGSHSTVSVRDPTIQTPGPAKEGIDFHLAAGQVHFCNMSNIFNHHWLACRISLLALTLLVDLLPADWIWIHCCNMINKLYAC